MTLVAMVRANDGRYLLNDLEGRNDRDLIDISSVDMKKTTKLSQSRYHGVMAWIKTEHLKNTYVTAALTCSLEHY
jgi:hypothetical protein